MQVIASSDCLVGFEPEAVGEAGEELSENQAFGCEASFSGPRLAKPDRTSGKGTWARGTFPAYA